MRSEVVRRLAAQDDEQRPRRGDRRSRSIRPSAGAERSSLVIAGNAAMIAVLFSPTDKIARQLAVSTSLGYESRELTQNRHIGPRR